MSCSTANHPSSNTSPEPPEPPTYHVCGALGEGISWLCLDVDLSMKPILAFFDCKSKVCIKDLP